MGLEKQESTEQIDDTSYFKYLRKFELKGGMTMWRDFRKKFPEVSFNKFKQLFRLASAIEQKEIAEEVEDILGGDAMPTFPDEAIDYFRKKHKKLESKRKNKNR